MGGLLKYKKVIETRSQNEESVTLSNDSIAIGILVHHKNPGRTTEIAVLKRTPEEGIYEVEPITEKTNIGKGFTVASDGLSIKCDGALSNKVVYIIVLRGTAAFT